MHLCFQLRRYSPCVSVLRFQPLKQRQNSLFNRLKENLANVASPDSGCDEITQAKRALPQEARRKQGKMLRSPSCPGKIPVLQVTNTLTPFFFTCRCTAIPEANTNHPLTAELPETVKVLCSAFARRATRLCFPSTSYDGLVAKLCLTLLIPWAVARQAPQSIVFSRQEYRGGLPLPSLASSYDSFSGFCCVTNYIHS